MELHRLPAGTPNASGVHAATAAARQYGDRQYGDRPPCSVRGGPASWRPPPLPRGPPVGTGPAAARVPTLPPAGPRGAGAWPDHSYCSWAWGPGGPGGRGAPGAEGRWRNDGPVGAGLGGGGGGGRRGGETVGEWEEMESPSPPPSAGQHSALSSYDNLHDGPAHSDAATPMETNILFPYSEEEDCFLCPYDEEEIGDVATGAASRDSSLWSSCEIILAGSRCSDRGGPDAPEEEEDVASEAPYSSQTALPDPDRWPPAAVGPAWTPPRVRVPPPLPLADPAASALRSVLTGLQHQIGRQRDEYEARISSLEQRNQELHSQLLGLRANLSQQRRWYQAVQAKIQESERARAAAEARNASIQREMDQFLDTFGELNNEAKKAERIVRSF